MQWLQDNFGWMHWTLPTAVAALGLLATLVAMTVWEGRSPSAARKGFLPIPTTRGDRLFIVIVLFLGIHLIWLAVIGAKLLWLPLAIALLVCALTARRG